MSEERKPPLRIYTEQTSDIGGLWAFKPYAMIHVEFVEVSDYYAERDRADIHAARIAELERQLAEARDQALEDARQAVHEALVGNSRYDAARLTARDAIRAMKGAKP